MRTPRRRPAWALLASTLVACSSPARDQADAAPSAPPPVSTAAVAASASAAVVIPTAASSAAQPVAGVTPDLPDVESDPMRGWPAGYSPSMIRDRVEVDIGQGPETWLLRWKKAPKPACFTAEARKLARCLGLAGPGESGPIEIVRVRDGAEVAASDLTPIFGQEDAPVIARFPPGVRFSAKALTEAKATKVMDLRDYNQDGRAAEFVLVGRYNPRRGPPLDRIGHLTGLSPNGGGLFSYAIEGTGTWESVRTMTDTFELVLIPCNDHASDLEYVDVFTRTPRGVTREMRKYRCLPTGARGRLAESEGQKPLGF